MHLCLRIGEWRYYISRNQNRSDEYEVTHQPLCYSWHCDRLLEEAQGQRRLVSFGRGITLSGTPQRSQVSHGGGSGGRGSPGDICEISSDESDRDDAASLSSQSAPRNARAVGDDLGLALDDVSAVDDRKKSNSKRDQCEGSGRSGNRGKAGRGSSGTRSLVSPTLEAFERLFSGEDFPMGSPASPRSKPSGGVGPGYDQTTDRRCAEDGRVASVGKRGGGASDSFEIALTRVVRAPRRSSNSLPTQSRIAEEGMRSRRPTPCASSSGSAGDGSDGQSDA